MIALIEDNRIAIAGICERYGVRRLSLFGSAAKGTFDPATSDLDFVVDLGDYDDRVGKRFMGLVVALEDLLGQRVDVVTEPLRKQWLRDEIQATRVVLHESTRRQSVA